MRSAETAVHRFATAMPIAVEPVAETSGIAPIARQAVRPTVARSPMSREKIAGSAPVVATDALRDLGHGDRGERRFLRRLPDGRIATDRGQGRVPRPDRNRKIKCGNDGDDAKRMPLLHQAMVRPFRLNRQAIKHPRLADGEVADVDHLLHFAFAFREDLARLERDEVAQIALLLAQSVAELPDGFSAHRPGRGSPFRESFLGAADHLFVIVRRCGAKFA